MDKLEYLNLSERANVTLIVRYGILIRSFTISVAVADVADGDDFDPSGSCGSRNLARVRQSRSERFSMRPLVVEIVGRKVSRLECLKSCQQVCREAVLVSETKAFNFGQELCRRCSALGFGILTEEAAT